MQRLLLLDTLGLRLRLFGLAALLILLSRLLGLLALLVALALLQGLALSALCVLLSGQFSLLALLLGLLQCLLVLDALGLCLFGLAALLVLLPGLFGLLALLQNLVLVVLHLLLPGLLALDALVGLAGASRQGGYQRAQGWQLNCRRLRRQGLTLRLRIALMVLGPGRARVDALGAAADHWLHEQGGRG